MKNVSVQLVTSCIIFFFCKIPNKDTQNAFSMINRVKSIMIKSIYCLPVGKKYLNGLDVHEFYPADPSKGQSFEHFGWISFGNIAHCATKATQQRNSETFLNNLQRNFSSQF